MRNDQAGTVAREPAAGARQPAAARSGRRPGRLARRLSLLPGLGFVAATTALAFLAARVLPAAHAPTVAVALGAVAANLGLHRPVLQPGTRFATHRLLRIAVVLLGLQLGIPQLAALGLPGLGIVVLTVAVTFTGTQLLGRALGVPPARTLLVATGFSICGASAIAAMEEVADGDEDDTAVAVALVTVCGTLAIVLLPALRGPLGLDPAGFGSWVGASVHDVGQTVATASRVDGSLTDAVVVKLSRVALLAPLVAGVALTRARRGTGSVGTRRPPVLPLFVAGFLGAIVLASTGLLPDRVLTGAETVQQVLLTCALVGLGTGIHHRVLRSTGVRSLCLGLASWLLVAAVAYAGVRLLG
ncbi:putative sulfate exporter family transporter [Micromonospora sonneratiae]|uniref:YeiH family protein n=1 Tax=Micromonospora sonneratiae TaxID=1184706 RepID=A0ABW3YKG8_9ACTN